MKKYLFACFFLGLFFSFSQDNRYRGKQSTETEIYGRVEGKVQDVKTKLNLEYANVSLFKSSNFDNQESVLLNGTITNNKGVFSFNKLETGSYFLEISYTGYTTKIINFIITGKKLNKNLRTILLELDPYILDNVDVLDQAPVYENKIEKIVYNVENDLSQSANDGIDVLRNAPLVSVDIDDKVSIRGSGNVKFLLNGKTSSFLHGDNISDVLQTIPAEQIKSIEVITTPTAKYDAEGDAGIINIITKQKQIQGFSAGVNTSTGTRVNRSSFNLNAGKNRFGISASGGARYGWPRNGNTSSSNILFDSQNNILTEQRNAGTFVGNWVGFRGSMDVYYDFNQYNSITSNIHIGGQNKSNDGEENIFFADMALLENVMSEYFEIYDVENVSSNNDTEYEGIVNYRKTFPDKENQELLISFQYGSHIHDDDQEMSQIGYQDNSIKNSMDGSGYELTGQIDYTHPFGEDNKFEIGLKRISRYTTNDYKTTVDNYISNTWLDEDSLTNVFNYDQIVSAAYFSTNFNLFNDFTLLLGTRYEHTDISGSYKDTYAPFNNSYNNIVPSVILSKKLNMFKNLKLSYVNRIQRPDIHRINTNVEIDDLNNISRGNPELMPSKTHQFELGYNSFKPGLMTSFSLYYKLKKDVVEAFTFLRDDDVFETNYLNTGDNQSLGFNFYGSTTIRKIISLRGSLDIFSYNMSTNINDIELLRRSLSYNYMLNANVDLGKGYKVDSRIFFRSPRQTIQGERPSFSMMSFGFKKDFSNKRGSIGVGMIEPFSAYKSFDTTIEGVMANGNRFETIREYEILFRSVNITFKYKFGQLNFDPIKKKAVLENDDLLEEEDDH